MTHNTTFFFNIQIFIHVYMYVIEGWHLINTENNAEKDTSFWCNNKLHLGQVVKRQQLKQTNKKILFIQLQQKQIWDSSNEKWQ